jgi:glucose/arabinose dehydrogenase
MRQQYFQAALALWALALCATCAAAQTSTVRLEPVMTGLSSPVLVTHAGDGSGRLFVVEQSGRIKVLQPGATAPTEFLNLSTKISTGGERGLLGLAFHPQFRLNRRFFVNYTRAGDGATVVAEYRASASDPNKADTTEAVLLTVAQPFANHNGGMIEFGPDGYLYVGMGDGGSANDPGNRAQNVNDLLGKMLRIDVDRPGATLPYSTPADNPFFGETPGRDEIFALGLRNPWRFSFDRVTGQLYAGDVGQGQREEVSVIVRGGNYGWRVYEGTRCTGLDAGACVSANYAAPLFEYDHGGGRCSITGGYAYRGARQTFALGTYLYGDYCTGEVLTFQSGTQSVLLNAGGNISSFGEDEAGEIYVVIHGGTVSRFVNSNSPPLVTGVSAADYSLARGVRCRRIWAARR